MDLKINNSAFEIQVLSTLAIKRQGDIKIFQFASAMRRDKNGRRLNRNLCILRQQWQELRFGL